MGKLRVAISVMTAVILLFVGATAAQAATWSSSDCWGTWSNGGYTVRNNVWGGGAGPQTIWANSYSNWGVWANHPNTGGVKAYPHAEQGGEPAAQLARSLSSNFNVSYPNSGCLHHRVRHLGQQQRLRDHAVDEQGRRGRPDRIVPDDGSVGGHTWDVYRGSNGSNQVFSFVRTSNTGSGTVDIKAVMNWIRNRGWFGDVTVGDVQFGYEITSSSGGLNFTTNQYSVSWS